MMHKRSKAKYGNVKNIPDMYKFYKAKYPKTKVTLKQYRMIIEEMNQHITSYMLEEAGEFKMPFGMGIIRVKKKPQNLKNLSLDYKYFRETGEKLYHLNEHSDGYESRFFWDKYAYGVRLKNKTKYSFIFSRTNKRLLARLIKEHNKDYFE
jgi:hypothetical protein